MGNILQTFHNLNAGAPAQDSRYTLSRDIPDPRDQRYTHPHYLAATPNVDLRDKCPQVYDQGKLGSCSANALAFAYQYDEVKQVPEKSITGDSDSPDCFLPSRLYIYYNERVRENHPDSDSGASLRDGIKSINQEGVCPESMWPYDIAQFATRPTQECYQEGKKHQAVKYQRVTQSEQDFKKVLSSGYPIVFGFLVYPSFESDEVSQTGLVPMPASGGKPLGGHAVAMVGYRYIEPKTEDSESDSETEGSPGISLGKLIPTSQLQFIVRNSWGPGWGDNGYCYFPADYLLDADLAFDFWVVQQVQGF